ncbi:MAG: pyridoxal-dependent decarboxylase, partial [Myxococcota bacterium]
AEHDAWLHVDGCYGGSALFSPRERVRLAGVERAQSFAWNLHKMMGMTQQCSVLLVREPEQLGPCFSARADYLFQPDKPYAHLDTGDRTFQCARRNDVLKLWLTWKARGDEGFGARVDRAVDLAQYARDRIADRAPAFVAVVAGTFTNVCFVWVPPELRPFDGSEAARDHLHGVTATLKAALQKSGVAMLSHMPVNGLNAFRLLVMNPTVTEVDIDTTLDTIDALGRDLTSA